MLASRGLATPAPEAKKSDGPCIKVSNLAPSTSSFTLKESLQAWGVGGIVDVKMSVGRTGPIAILTFKTQQEAQIALQANGIDVDHMPLRLEYVPTVKGSKVSSNDEGEVERPARSSKEPGLPSEYLRISGVPPAAVKDDLLSFLKQHGVLGILEIEISEEEQGVAYVRFKTAENVKAALTKTPDKPMLFCKPLSLEPLPDRSEEVWGNEAWQGFAGKGWGGDGWSGMDGGWGGKCGGGKASWSGDNGSAAWSGKEGWGGKCSWKGDNGTASWSGNGKGKESWEAGCGDASWSGYGGKSSWSGDAGGKDGWQGDFGGKSCWKGMGSEQMTSKGSFAGKADWSKGGKDMWLAGPDSWNGSATGDWSSVGCAKGGGWPADGGKAGWHGMGEYNVAPAAAWTGYGKPAASEAMWGKGGGKGCWSSGYGDDGKGWMPPSRGYQPY